MNYSIYCNNDFGCHFGYDLVCFYKNDEKETGYSINFGYSFELPNGINFKTKESKSYLSGSINENTNRFKIIEIEVFIIEK